MKKFPLFPLFALMISSTLLSQNFSIGAEIGFNSSQINRYDFFDFQNRRNTFYQGLNFNYQYSESVSFTSGIHYLRQGYRFKTCYTFEPGVKNQLTGKLDYLTIPLLVNIHWLKSRKIITSTGILGGWNIKAAQDYPQPSGGCQIGYIDDLSSLTRDFSVSGMVGFGYQFFEQEHHELIIMLKYYHGFSNYYENLPYERLNLRNHSLLLNLLYNIKW